jgi:hypothetical protein
MRIRTDTASVALAFLSAYAKDTEGLDPDTLGVLDEAFKSVYDPYTLVTAIAVLAGPKVSEEYRERLAFNIEQIVEEHREKQSQ